MDVAVVATNVALVSAVVSSGFGLHALKALPPVGARAANLLRGGAALAVGGGFAALAALLDPALTFNQAVTLPGTGLLMMGGWLQTRRFHYESVPKVECRDDLVVAAVENERDGEPRRPSAGDDVMSCLMAAGISPTRIREAEIVSLSQVPTPEDGGRKRDDA